MQRGELKQRETSEASRNVSIASRADLLPQIPWNSDCRFDDNVFCLEFNFHGVASYTEDTPMPYCCQAVLLGQGSS